MTSTGKKLNRLEMCIKNLKECIELNYQFYPTKTLYTDHKWQKNVPDEVGTLIWLLEHQ